MPNIAGRSHDFFLPHSLSRATVGFKPAAEEPGLVKMTNQEWDVMNMVGSSSKKDLVFYKESSSAVAFEGFSGCLRC